MLFLRRIVIKGTKHSLSISTKINEKTFEGDHFTNVTPKIISLMNRNLYKQQFHPLSFIRERIVQFFYKNFIGRRGNPIFSVFDDLNPVVTLEQNFDSLLVPLDHPSRTKSDCYYINKDWMLRAHMTAHQSELLKMGLNNFLMVGDVYRRDDVNATHYPVFHQLDGVRLFTPEELFIENDDGVINLDVKESGVHPRTKHKQEVYTHQASSMVEENLKTTLENLSKDLFGNEIQYKWVEAFFPFTHPSWELEVLLGNKWVELLGCGIIEHKILEKAGCSERIGWAFGLGLERLAMLRYFIPDIRLFWSTDSGFLHQFQGKSFTDNIKFKPFSVHPPCPFDISFWLGDKFELNDFYEWARENWGDIIEQIELVDTYKCKKTGRTSLCFRIVYRSMEKTFTKVEVQKIHDDLVEKCEKLFNVKVR